VDRPVVILYKQAGFHARLFITLKVRTIAALLIIPNNINLLISGSHETFFIIIIIVLCLLQCVRSD
jgi:hypothetical protein